MSPQQPRPKIIMISIAFFIQLPFPFIIKCLITSYKKPEIIVLDRNPIMLATLGIVQRSAANYIE